MIKLIKYDLKVGFANVRNKLLIFISLIIFINIIGNKYIFDFATTTNITPDFLDYICFVVGGPMHIPKGMLDIYVVPVLWLLIQVMIAYTIGDYAITDLNRYGLQVLMRSVSRVKWWISKIIWNVLMVIFMYLIMYFIIFVMAIIAGAKFEWVLTESIACGVCNITSLNGVSQIETMIVLFVMPIVVSVTLSILQMVIGLIFYPIIGFISSQSIVFLSTIYEFKWLISNYAMLSHNKLTCFSEIDYREGIGICIAVYVISIAVGIIYFMNYDILSKNQEI